MAYTKTQISPCSLPFSTNNGKCRSSLRSDGIGDDLDTDEDSKTTNCRLESLSITLLKVKREGMVAGLGDI